MIVFYLDTTSGKRSIKFKSNQFLEPEFKNRELRFASNREDLELALNEMERGR